MPRKSTRGGESLTPLENAKFDEISMYIERTDQEGEVALTKVRNAIREFPALLNYNHGWLLQIAIRSLRPDFTKLLVEMGSEINNDTLGVAKDMMRFYGRTNDSAGKAARAIQSILKPVVARKKTARTEAKDLASGEMSGLLRESDKTSGLAPPGSAMDRAMATGILPSQVGKFLTSDPNINKASVKPAINSLKQVVRGSARRRKTRRNKKSRK
jgi:hypothetical protein